MQTALELTSTAIRIAQYDQNRLIRLESLDLPEGSDPIAALSSAPLPTPLGNVRVLMNHRDLLIRTFIQPPTTPERLDRLIHFEVQSLDTDGSGLLASWNVIPVGGAGDMRVLTLIGKQGLVGEVTKAISQHGGKLTGLSVNAVGLYHAWRLSHPTHSGCIALIDVGAEFVHIALVYDGELAFVRSQSPGMQPVIDDIAELRGIDPTAASELVMKLGKGAPDDIKNIIDRHASQVATQITNCVRFAKAQLQLNQLELQEVYLAGSGARLAGFADTVASRTRCPARLINPFAPIVTSIDDDHMDRDSWLPGPWGATIGSVASDDLSLDLMNQVRAQRRQYWSTSGALRLAAVAAAVLLSIAVVLIEVSSMAQTGAEEELHADGQGLVPSGEAVVKQAQDLRADIGALQNQARFLHQEQAGGRVAVEFLNLIAALQDPGERPVYVRAYRLNQGSSGAVRIELDGFSENASNRSKADVLNDFKKQLQASYPGISAILELPVAAHGQRQEFRWVIDLTVSG